MAEDRIYTTPQLAERLGITPRALNELARAGKIGYVRISKKCRVFREKDLRDFLAANAVDQRSKPLISSPRKEVVKSQGDLAKALLKEMRGW